MHLPLLLLIAKPKLLQAQKQFQQLRRLSNQRFHLLIFDWRTKTYPKWSKKSIQLEITKKPLPTLLSYRNLYEKHCYNNDNKLYNVLKETKIIFIKKWQIVLKSFYNSQTKGKTENIKKYRKQCMVKGNDAKNSLGFATGADSWYFLVSSVRIWAESCCEVQFSE